VANDYEHFSTYMVGVRANLDTVRKNIRYHINNPNLLADLHIDEIRRQLDEIEARALSKDTSKPHRNVNPFDILPNPEVAAVDTRAGIAQLVDSIYEAQQVTASCTPLLYMDCEGFGLGRNGSITLLQLYIPMQEMVYIVDVQTLGAETFSTSDTKNTANLKVLLEASTPVKVMWDCRADSDALYAHYNVALNGVIDAQLAENATNPKSQSNRTVIELLTCVEKRLNLSAGKIITFSETKAMGRDAMNEGIDFVVNHTKKIGDEESGYQWISTDDVGKEDRVKEGRAISAMAERPVHPYLINYCVQDVVVLPQILDRCMQSRFWSVDWQDRVINESNAAMPG
jgi:exonuclease 3'-5' domain-containing protein 1